MFSFLWTFCSNLSFSARYFNDVFIFVLLIIYNVSSHTSLAAAAAAYSEQQNQQQQYDYSAYGGYEAYQQAVASKLWKGGM